LAPEGLTKSISGPWPKNIVHHCSILCWEKNFNYQKNQSVDWFISNPIILGFTECSRITFPNLNLIWNFNSLWRCPTPLKSQFLVSTAWSVYGIILPLPSIYEFLIPASASLSGYLAGLVIIRLRQRHENLITVCIAMVVKRAPDSQPMPSP